MGARAALRGPDFFAVRVEFVAGARETRRKPAQPADCTTEVADCLWAGAGPPGGTVRRAAVRKRGSGSASLS